MCYFGGSVHFNGYCLTSAMRHPILPKNIYSRLIIYNVDLLIQKVDEVQPLSVVSDLVFDEWLSGMAMQTRREK